MKKTSLLFLSILSLILISGCGVKNLDDVVVANTWSTNTVAIVIPNTADFVDGSGNFVGAEVENFASGSSAVVNESGVAIANIKASRASDEWCVWKQYSKYGVTFLGEECNLDGRSLKLVNVDSKNAFAIKQDDYDIDPENMEDTLGVQVFDVKKDANIADAIREVVWNNCDIKTIQDKKVGDYDIYTVHTIDAQDSTCNGFGNVDAPDNSMDKIFVVNPAQKSKFVFMNLKNQQNIIDLNNFKIN